MRKEVVFDIETKSAPQGWDDRGNLGSLGISVIGVWTSEDNQCRTFREENLAELEPIIKNADRLIGFAIKRFDIPVLQPYMHFDLTEVPALDMFEDVSERLGHRVSLASLSKATLNQDKLGHGLDAVTWYRAGEWQKLEEYCAQDVKLTRDLYHFGMNNGYLLFHSFVDQKAVSVPVSWGMPDVTEIRSLVTEALNSKRIMEIDYVSREDSGKGFLKTRKVEIQSIRNDEIEAYDHLREDVRNFRIGRILRARILEDIIQPRPVAQSLFT